MKWRSVLHENSEFFTLEESSKVCTLYKPCESMAPIATSDESVVNINSLLKAGDCNIGSLYQNFLS